MRWTEAEGDDGIRDYWREKNSQTIDGIANAARRRNQWLNRPLDGTLRGRVFVVEIPLQGRIAASVAGAVSSVG